MTDPVEAQDYNEQLPMRMGAPQAPAQALNTDPRPSMPPMQGPPPVNDPTKPIIMPTGLDSTTVGDTDKTAWSDYAKAAWQRVEGMGAAALGAASLSARKLGANPDTIQHIEQMRAGVAQSLEESINSMTPAAQKALHASVFGGQDENGEHIPTPGEVGWSRFLALNAASFVPDALLAAVTARVGGAAAPAILGSVYGTMQAGEAYEKLVDEVDKTKPQDWANSPAMQAMLQQGMSFDDAKKQIVDHAANQLGALNFGIGALTGAGGMGLLMKGPLGSVGKNLLSRLGLGATEGAATMGLQGGGEEFAQENATNQIGLTNGFDTDKLARAAASGALGGLAIGAAGGALHGAHEAPPATLNPRGEETATPGPSTGLVSPELQAALDLGDAGTGFVRGQPQGELFRTTEQANQGGNQNLPPASGGPRPAAMGDEQLALSVDTPQPAKTAPPGFVGDSQQGQLFRTPEEMAQSRTPPQAAAPQQVQPELMAKPGTVGANPQGELFRTAEEANAPGRGSGPVPAGGGAGTPAQGSRPSAGMSRGDLLDALKTMPNQDPKALARMSKGDLATAYDKASGPAQPAVAPSTPEPQRDIDAQMAAVADKSNPKDAMFVAKGSPEPSSKPKGVFKAVRDEGALYSTSAKKIAAFRKSDLSDDSLGKILGYTESKADAVKSGSPTVVQAKDANGAVVHDQLASPKGVKAAQDAAAERVPEGGSVVVTTPEEGQNRRAQEAAQAPAEPATSSAEPKAETPPTPSPEPAKPISAAERLKAQRAARKAAMAPPGERMKGVVATVEAEPTRTSSTEKSEPRTHEQAMADVEEGVREFKVQPLKKGADITRAMNTVIQELTDRLKGTKTEGDVAEAVAKWARSNGSPLPGTTTRRIDIGNHVVQLLTGKNADEFSGRAQRVRAELAREPAPEVRYEKDANREDITEGERTVAHAVAEPTTVVEKEPTKIVDQLPHWLGRVLSGDMGVQEAHEAYGLPKGNGRPRKYPTFADYIDDRIRMAEDPKVEEELRGRLSELKDMPTSQAKSAETNRINQLLETTGKDAADRLRALKEELDPVRAAADEEAPPTARAADKLKARLAEIRAGKQPPELGRLATVLHDPRVNDAVNRMLDSGQPHTLKDYLGAIGKDEVVGREAPEMAALARRMLGMVKDNIPVDSSARPGEAGTYYPMAEPGLGSIGVNPRSVASSVETLLHEGLHSITAHYIEGLPATHPDRLALDAMHAELKRVLDTSRGTMDATNAREVEYALSNVHELHTMLMTNPAVQQLAAAARPSFAFQGRMRALGYGLDAVKSVWAAFTQLVRRAMGLKGPVTPRDASLLDHVMKPLQDITERAAAFNRAPPDNINFAVEHALPDFNAREKIDDALKTVDLKTVGDKGRTGLLAAATTDGIVKWNTPLFESRDPEAPGNAIKDYHRADEAISARKKAFSDKYADQINDWAKGIQGKERNELASLLVDASTANVRLGAKADNSHLTTVGQHDRLKALQARYDALSSTARASYDESHRLQDAMDAEEREARLSSMLKGVMKGADKDQIDALRDVAKSRKSLDAFLNDPDNSAVAAKFGAEWGNVRALVKGVASIHKMGFVDGDYFPLHRYGDYVLSYGEKGNTESYGMERFATIAQAEARRTELLGQKTENLSQVQSLRENHMRDVVSMPAMDEITSAMKRRGDAKADIDAMHDLMASVVMQHATHSEGARARLRRQGVLGASKDVEKVVAQDYLATAARIGYLEHGVDRAQALQRMQDHANTLGMDGAPGEQRVAQAVVRELQKRTASNDDGDSIVSKVLRKASSFGYVQSLQSFSHMFTSTFEAHTNSTALLGARHGPIQAAAALAKALKDSSPVIGLGAKNMVKAVGKGLRASDWNLSTVVRDQMVKNGANAAHMTKLFDALNGAGLLDHTFVRELARMANPSGQRLTQVAGWWGKFMDLNAAAAHAVDVANKSAVAKAAFDLEMRKTGDVNKAIDYAMDTARSAMPNYNSSNKARIARGLLSPAMQFKNYGFHMYSMLGNLVHTWTHDASPEARKEARNAFAGIIFTHALMAGAISGSPLGDILRWVGGFYDWATGAAKPHDYENDIRRMIADLAGPQLGEIISRGLPHAVGIDIHRRVGLSNLLEPPELKSFDKAGFGEALETALTGAAGQDATTLLGAFTKIRNGDMTGAIKDMTPREFRDAYKAYGLAENGVTDSKGQTVLPADRMSWRDILAQAVGFQPARVSEFREARAAVLEARDEAKTEHNHLVQSWVRADPEDRADIMEQISAYNIRNAGQRITSDTLLKAAKQHRDAMKEANAATFGLTLPRKARGYLSSAGGFANVGQ